MAHASIEDDQVETEAFYRGLYANMQAAKAKRPCTIAFLLADLNARVGQTTTDQIGEVGAEAENNNSKWARMLGEETHMISSTPFAAEGTRGPGQDRVDTGGA